MSAKSYNLNCQLPFGVKLAEIETEGKKKKIRFVYLQDLENFFRRFRLAHKVELDYPAEAQYVDPQLGYAKVVCRISYNGANYWGTGEITPETTYSELCRNCPFKTAQKRAFADAMLQFLDLGVTKVYSHNELPYISPEEIIDADAPMAPVEPFLLPDETGNEEARSA